MFYFRLAGLVSLTLLFLGLSEGAQKLIPSYLDPVPIAEYIDGEINEEDTSILGLTIGRNTVEEVNKKFGKTVIFKAGPEYYEPNIMCYLSCGESDETCLEFYSGPFWNEKIIDSFVVRPLTSQPYYKYNSRSMCKKSFLINKEIATKSGISLGINKKRFISIVGRPTLVRGNVLMYRYKREKKMTDKEIKLLENIYGQRKKGYQTKMVLSEIDAYFSDNKLVWFSVSKGALW